MRTRTLVLAVLVATAGLSIGLSQAPRQTKAVRTSAVYCREPGGKEWQLFGYYESESAARGVFDHLDAGGFETQLRVTSTPIPHTEKSQVVARGNKSLPIEETVTMERATELFQKMSKQPDLAFRFPLDGCYARAELMVERLAKLGAKPRKIWAVANGEELYAKTKDHPKGFVTWAYHVAPALRVRDKDDLQRWYVIDPSLFAAPATVTDWMQAQMKKEDGYRPYMTVTLPGNPPTWVDNKKRNGSGYWPGGDPKEGVREHALTTMKRYKPWEGKERPKSFGRLGAEFDAGGAVAFWIIARDQ